MKRNPLTRVRLCLVVLSAIVLGGSLAVYRPTAIAADNAPATPAGTVVDFADQIGRLVQDHKFDKLASLTIPVDPNDDLTFKLGLWKAHYVSQVKEAEALREKQYNEAVAKAKDFVGRNKYEEAIDKTVGAYLLTHDQEGFLNLDWVKELTGRVAEQAAKYEKEGRWLESLQLYSDLNSLFEIDTRYKADMQRLARRTRLLALYTPKALFEMRKTMAAKLERDKTDGPTTSTTQQDLDKEPASFPRWQDHVENITLDMANRALDQARANWVEGTNYETLLRGGVEAMRLFLTTPELAKEFPALGDGQAKAMFAEALNSALAQIKPEERLTTAQMHRILDEILEANRKTVKIPEAVAIMEFTDGAMEKLDPFTAVIWPREADEFRKGVDGRFGGVGVQISLENGLLKVISPLEETPAFKAGIEADDVITAIDGQSTVGITIDQAVHRIMGKANTQVKLTVRRAGVKDPLDFNLTRAEIRVSSVKGFRRDPKDLTRWNYMIDPESKIGYIRITGFQEDTADELRAAVEGLQKAGARAMVLDLRFNPGGLLKAAVEMSDMFIDHGIIVSTKGNRVARQIVPAREDTIIPNSVPIAVLINQYSASASEIFSGAMKDLHRAIIVGSRSFGKGSVQNVIPIGDPAAIKLTMSYYYLPDGESLHRRDGEKKWGVEPDVVMDMTPAQVGALMKARRDSEIIATKTNGAASAPAATAPTTGPSTQKAAEPLIDTQLDTALLMLRIKLVQPKT